MRNKLDFIAAFLALAAFVLSIVGFILSTDAVHHTLFTINIILSFVEFVFFLSEVKIDE